MTTKSFREETKGRTWKFYGDVHLLSTTAACPFWLQTSAGPVSRWGCRCPRRLPLRPCHRRCLHQCRRRLLSSPAFLSCRSRLLRPADLAADAACRESWWPSRSAGRWSRLRHPRRPCTNWRSMSGGRGRERGRGYQHEQENIEEAW